MRTLVRNVILVIAVLLLAVYSILPVEKKLRLGKDLRGGVSLVYAVHLKPGDPPDVMDRVMEVVKERIDPAGQADISIVQQGSDRIEITMPLPSDKVKRLKADFEQELQKLGQASLDPAKFERLMRVDGSQREEEIVSLAGGSPARAAQLRAAAEAHDHAVQEREQLSAAQAEAAAAREGGADAAVVAQLESRIEELVSSTADAELAYEEARTEALRAAISPAEVRRALSLSTEQRRTISPTGKEELLPSPRERALERLREESPQLAESLNSVIASYERYAAQRTRLDDPADLKRMLAGAGVLDFRITVEPNQLPDEPRLRRELRERGPRNVQFKDARWYKVNKLDAWYDDAAQFEDLLRDPGAYFGARYGLVGDEFDGEYYILAWDVPANRLTQAEGDWAVAGGFQGSDEIGRPAINFEMNSRGATLLNTLTRTHVGKNMAVLLDDEVYTAPNLRNAIGKNGQISGSFSDSELRYIIRVLSAGAMQAKLSQEPISESAIGPKLGLDNLRKGLFAGVVALIVIGAFMVVYYFGFGVVAVFALLCNGLLLMMTMSWLHAAFTLPGIAGVILTFGMAVDANVLIYERIREELRKGADLRTALRLGYSKALSSIVDGNVTNLIVCVVLYYVGTQEIKGFAITLGVGVLTTLFSALVISRVVFSALIDYGPWQRGSMLPMKYPAIDRFFNRQIDWLRYRHVFWVVSACWVALGLGMVLFQGRDMLDNEFRGGTQVTLELNQQMERPAVENIVHDVGAAAAPGDDLAHLRTADVLPVDPGEDGITSNQFTIKTLALNQNAVLKALTTAFADYTESQPPLHFAGSDAQELRQAPVYRIVSGTIGEDIDRPQYRDDVRPFVGGVAILLEDIDPPQPLAAIESRLDLMRGHGDFSVTLSRQWEVRVLDGNDRGVRTAVILVRDPAVSFFNDEARFDAEVARAEWQLVQRALTEVSVPASVQNFSAAIAASFKARAVVAIVLSFLLIGIYVWVRFGALNFAAGAVVPLVVDAFTAIGFVALAEVIYSNASLQPIARSLGIMPFKVDLNMVAAILTLIGYSLNDSIVIMDRIRENRGKLPYVSRQNVNDSINQTLSRTIITSGTTLLATMIIYLLGGEGMRGFAFVLTVGIVSGTFSTLALTAPCVWSRKGDRMEADRRKPAPPPAVAASV